MGARPRSGRERPPALPARPRAPQEGGGRRSTRFPGPRRVPPAVHEGPCDGDEGFSSGFRDPSRPAEPTHGRPDRPRGTPVARLRRRHPRAPRCELGRPSWRDARDRGPERIGEDDPPEACERTAPPNERSGLGRGHRYEPLRPERLESTRRPRLPAPGSAALQVGRQGRGGARHEAPRAGAPGASPPSFGLSLGESKRLALAAALSSDPKIILVDEPPTGQDLTMKIEIMDLLQTLNGTGRTVILVTHDMDIVAKYARRVVVMADGKVLLDGPTREVLRGQDVLSRAHLKPPPVIALSALMSDRAGVPTTWLTTDEVVSLLG